MFFFVAILSPCTSLEISQIGRADMAELGRARTGMKEEGWFGSLKVDPTEWLCEQENPVTRYWTLRDILDAPEHVVEEAHREALETKIVKEVFRQQRKEGHWEGSRNMHAPHYTSTIYQLSLLGDLGVAGEDPIVKKGVRAVLRTQREDGGFPGHNPQKCPYGPYDIGLVIRFMHQFGMSQDRHLDKMYRWVEEHQNKDGGWIGTKGEGRPDPRGCLNATTNVLWGLGYSEELAGSSVARRGLSFLSGATAPDRSDPKNRRQLSYPQFWNWWIDDIKLAETYIRLGARPDKEPLKGCLGSIMTLQEDTGSWLERHGTYPQNHENCRRMRGLFPRKGEPSKWVTAKALTVLKKAHLSSST
jgi:hypothetical protein